VGIAAVHSGIALTDVLLDLVVMVRAQRDEFVPLLVAEVVVSPVVKLVVAPSTDEASGVGECLRVGRSLGVPEDVGVLFLERHLVDVDVIEPTVHDGELALRAGASGGVVEGDSHTGKVASGPAGRSPPGQGRARR
jgi:hypothetical protein